MVRAISASMRSSRSARTGMDEATSALGWPSTAPEVDLHDTSGAVLGQPSAEVASSMPVRAERDDRIEALIARTIAEQSTR